MTMKRNRSSLSSFVSSPDDPTAADGSRLSRRDLAKKSLKQSATSDDFGSGSRIGIFTISSPSSVYVKEGTEGGGGGSGGGSAVAFYEKCGSCEKKIDSDKDVYMYSYLRAFCSTKCRDRQIYIDTKTEILSRLMKGTKQPEHSSSTTSNVIRLFGVQIAEAQSAQRSAQQSHVKRSSNRL